MDSLILKRILEEYNYIIKTNETVREIALKFNVSKSTVHKDLVERLKKIDKKKYAKVKCIMDYHLKIRHIKGGEATKLKYKAR